MVDFQTMLNWHTRYMNLAAHISFWSKDPETQVGAVIVSSDNRIVSVGYNGFPRKVWDNITDVPERYGLPEKYLWTEHAERNAIYNARTNLEGCTIYSTLYPCMDCARGIVQSGISMLVCPEPDWEDPMWQSEKVRVMLVEGEVEHWYYKEERGSE